jgi:hypothetical protein
MKGKTTGAMRTLSIDNPAKTLKTVSITFTECPGPDGNTAFRVHLTGDTYRIGKTDKRDLSPAEWWGLQCYDMVKGVIQRAGEQQALNVASVREETAEEAKAP